MPEPIRRGFGAVVAMLVMQFMAAGPVQADDPVGTVLERSGATAESLGEGSRAVLSGNLEEATAPENVTTTVRMALLLTVVSLVPSVLAMTPCYVRFLVVLGLLRQALAWGSCCPIRCWPRCACS